MTKPAPKEAPVPASTEARQRIAGWLIGLWLAVVTTKFGNPVIFEQSIDPPQGFYELSISTWPVGWSYGALVGLLLGAALVWKWKLCAPWWVLGALLFWQAWTHLSGLRTVDGPLTRLTEAHFAGCVLCFGAGYFGVSELRDRRPVWVGLAVGLAIILAAAFQQHFGGLEETRRAFDSLPEAMRARLDTPEFRMKMLSNRVFGTFIYPNALAGGLLLLLPVAVAGLVTMARPRALKAKEQSLLPPGMAGMIWFGRNASSLGALVAAPTLLVAAAAVLFWSGSKSGWLIAMVLGALALWQMPGKAPMKLALLIGLLGLGVGAFVGRHAGYFEKGASSLSARVDYWRAAGQMMQQRPVFGYGPGTFQRGYAMFKPPEAEMARLAHNDYLEQGSDSGLPAMFAYTAFVLGSVLLLYRRSRGTGFAFALWLGTVSFVLQGLSEFGLYIPALAWPCFLFLGWLWGTDSNRQLEAGFLSSPPKK